MKHNFISTRLAKYTEGGLVNYWQRNESMRTFFFFYQFLYKLYKDIKKYCALLVANICSTYDPRESFLVINPRETLHRLTRDLQENVHIEIKHTLFLLRNILFS